MNKQKRRYLYLLALAAVFFSVYQLYSYISVPEYRIVIDPGHGGLNPGGKKLGDKWDPLTRRYLNPYREGARHGKYTERIQMMKLSKEVYKLLQLTRSSSGFSQFKKVLRKFSPQKDFKHIRFKTLLTRDFTYPESSKKKDLRRGKDINAPFRHFDYPDHRGRLKPGRITKINDFDPELVVSLHLTPGKNTGGMAAVITPPYKVFNTARQYVFNPGMRAKYRQRFKDSAWSKWMIFTGDRSRFMNFICDAWIYFTGYWSKPNGLSPDLKKWRGYRWNMVDWAYADPNGWEKKAAKRSLPVYKTNYRQYRPQNAFFDRERAAPESWRRSGGHEGMGGDNYYAAMEIMRYVQYGLRRNVRDQGRTVKISPIEDPYFSTWEIPTHINAISAFIEIGFINAKHDMINMTRYRKEVAESIAVGIYSLYSGLKLHPIKGRFKPKGKTLNFDRYRKYKNNYFKMASQ